MKFLSFIYHGALHGDPIAFSFMIVGVLVIVGILSQRDGSYLQTRTSSEMTFGQFSWTFRAFFALLLGWMVFACPAVFLQGKPFPWAPMLLAFGATVIGVFRRLSSNRLAFDTQGRRYYCVSRWSWARASWKRRVRSGAYDDLRGICIKHITVKGSNFYSIGLAWNDDSDELWPLGRFSKLERANAFASELSQTLGLPLVEATILKTPKYRKATFK